MQTLPSNSFFQKFNQWSKRFDFWSLLSDFFFVFGVLVLDWSPLLLILYFMVDTAAMAFFAIVLFFMERNGTLEKFAFIALCFVMFCIMAILYYECINFLEDLVKLEVLDKTVESDPGLIFNPVIFPLILSFSVLNHYNEFKEEFARKRNGTYNSGFIKHFFLRYLFILGIIVIMSLSYTLFEFGIVIGLIVAKGALRLYYPRFRELV